MMLRLSVRDGRTLATQDIEVSAEPASSVASLLASLPVRVGDRRCYVGSEPLDPAATIGGSPLVSGAVISVGGVGPDPRALPGRAAGALVVVASLDVGAVVWLPPGRHVLGRDKQAAVCLSAPNVSPQHAQLEVSPQGQATVVDCGSASGTTVDGVPARTPLPLTPDSVVAVAGDLLRWVPLSTVRPTMTRSQDGRLDFHRAFAPAPAISRIKVELPAQQSTSRNITTLLLSILLPVGVGVRTSRPRWI